jgi:hypothetical protein
MPGGALKKSCLAKRPEAPQRTRSGVRPIAAPIYPVTPRAALAAVYGAAMVRPVEDRTMPRYEDGEIVATERVTANDKAASGSVRWVEDWRAYCTKTSLGANGPFDTKREATAALRRELRSILAPES